MRTEVERFFTDEVSRLTGMLAEMERRVDPSAEARKDDVFGELSVSIDRALAACKAIEERLEGDAQALKDAKARFRDAVAPWFDQSWFMHRSKVKPRGYPGDYELMASIYDGVPKSRGLGGYLDIYILNSTLGRAVTFRMQEARRFLIDELSRRRGEVSVLNVACGPCREYAGGLDRPDQSKIRITCVDADRQALEYVEARITTVAPPSLDLQCVCYNALRMSSAKANIERFGRPDIIYSVGLCDYIPDRPLIAMLRGWRETVNDGGVVYVALKDIRRYDKTVYQWALDWYFLERTEEDCRRLFEQAGYDMDGVTTTREATGAIMNFTCRPRVLAMVRVDAPERPREAHVDAASRIGQSAAPRPRGAT
jgi:SAM-dependent methyltransferase